MYIDGKIKIRKILYLCIVAKDKSVLYKTSIKIQFHNIYTWSWKKGERKEKVFSFPLAPESWNNAPAKAIIQIN